MTHGQDRTDPEEPSSDPEETDPKVLVSTARKERFGAEIELEDSPPTKFVPIKKRETTIVLDEDPVPLRPRRAAPRESAAPAVEPSAPEPAEARAPPPVVRSPEAAARPAPPHKDEPTPAPEPLRSTKPEPAVEPPAATVAAAPTRAAAPAVNARPAAVVSPVPPAPKTVVVPDLESNGSAHANGATLVPAPAETRSTVREAAAAPKRGLRRSPRMERWFQWFLGREIHEETAVTPVPPLTPPLTEVRLQEFIPGVTFSRIVLDRQRSRHTYQAIEPPLSQHEAAALKFVKEVLLRTLDAELEIIGRGPSDASLTYLDKEVKKAVRDYKIRLSPVSMKRISYYLTRDFTGYGPIDIMMHDPDIEDISCDGAGVPLFLYHRRYGSMETSIRFGSSDELDGFVIRMAQRSGKQITVADPLLDSSLPDGSRLQATLGREVTDNGSTFTIRRFREHPYSPIDLVKMGTMSPELLAYCWIVVQYGANVMLAGGTASGKTTTLNTVSLFVPPHAKIVSIEDTREINLPHENWVRSVTRGGTRATDAKRVDMFDLLTAALRQRPEYILVGEVRGKEATVAFQAMATGHTVMGTIHADSPRSVVYRLESEPINIPRIVIQALDVIIMQGMINVQGRRQRRVQQVAELVGIDPGSKELLTHDVFMRNASTDRLHFTGRSYKLERIAARNNWKAADLEREFRKRAQIVKTLVDAPPLTFAEIAQVFSSYENRPETIDEDLQRLIAKATQRGGVAS